MFRAFCASSAFTALFFAAPAVAPAEIVPVMAAGPAPFTETFNSRAPTSGAITWDGGGLKVEVVDDIGRNPPALEMRCRGHGVAHLLFNSAGILSPATCTGQNRRYRIIMRNPQRPMKITGTIHSLK